MANISLLSRLVNGVQRQVDLSSNTLIVNVLKVGGGAGTDLTKVILDKLILTNALTHTDGSFDNRYFTETEIGSTTNGSSGASLVGIDVTPAFSNFTPSANTVQGALEGIDTALGSAGVAEFSDATFRILDDATPSKKIAFQASGISASTTRTITMPDADVSLADVNNAILKDGSRTYTASQPMGGFKLTGLGAGSSAGDSVRYEQSILISGANAFAANQPMGGFKLTGLAAGSSAGDSVRYEQAILASGVNAFSANQSMGSNKLTNLADPTTAQDAATKAYVDSVAQGLKPKQAVRVGTVANVAIATGLEAGDVIDGITLVAGDRVLVKNQSSSAENGIYVASASGAAARATDFDSLSPIDEINGAYTFIEEGTQAGQGWVQSGAAVATIGTDPILFVYFNDNSSLVGGDMITVTGSSIAVDLHSTSGLESSNAGNAAGQLRVKLEASNPSLRITGSNELAAKLDAAGAITSGASGLIVGVDASTIEISSNALQLKALGITNSHVSASAAIAYSKLALSGSIVNADINASAAIAYSKLNLASSIVNADVAAGAAIAYSKLNLASSIVNADIAAGAAIALSKLASLTASRVLVSDGSGVISVASATSANLGTLTDGSNADALHSHGVLKQAVVVGESMAANITHLVRFAVSGETAGRVYKADNDATTTDKFYVVGVVTSGSALSAGDPATMITFGTYALAGSDAAFASGDIGKPVYLTTAGAFSTTAPTTTNFAVYRIAVVQTVSSMMLGNMQINGVN